MLDIYAETKSFFKELVTFLMFDGMKTKWKKKAVSKYLFSFSILNPDLLIKVIEGLLLMLLYVIYFAAVVVVVVVVVVV